MKSSVHITAPARVNPGDKISAAWANQVRDCIQRLTNRKQPDQRVPQVIEQLPFRITGGSTAIRAAAGTFCEEALPETVETSPSNGLWYFQGALTINSTTGAKSSASVEWTQTEGTDTSTTFYTTIGSIFIDAPNPPGAPTNFNYGPIVGLIHGGITDVWDVTFF